MKKEKLSKAIPLGNYDVVIDGKNYKLIAGEESSYPEEVVKQLKQMKLIKDGKL